MLYRRVTRPPKIEGVINSLRFGRLLSVAAMPIKVNFVGTFPQLNLVTFKCDVNIGGPNRVGRKSVYR
jgi:hypothetical protein